MPDFIRQTFAADVPVAWTELLLRQVFALLFGAAVAGVYALARGVGAERRSLMTTLVLLTILIATISSVIGDNVARAFSLVGALSIVRFRTVVEDTRDTAFVILAVGVGMALGSGHFLVPLLLIPTAGVAALIFGGHPSSLGDLYTITIRTSLGAADAIIQETLSNSSTKLEVRRVATARQGSALETEYRAVLLRDPRDVLNQISAIEGVVSADVERIGAS